MQQRISTRATRFLAFTATLAVLLLQPEAVRRVAAQNNAKGVVPYDSIVSDGETYAGPAQGSAWDATGSTIYIGLLTPLHGPETAEGEALLVAARLALHDCVRPPLPNGMRIELAIGDESGPAWGHVSDVILQLMQRKNVMALITSTNGTDTHVSEQVGNRIGIPILTLSSDAATTQIDIPWIFRLGPSDAVQAQAIAQNIYGERGLKHVMVISEADHDGRSGAAAIGAAANALGAPSPLEIVLDPLHSDLDLVAARIQAIAPQAIILWTQGAVTRKVLPLLQSAGITAPIYLSQQAAQAGSGLSRNLFTAMPGDMVVSDGSSAAGYGIAETAAQKSFAARYSQQTGTAPSEAAAEAYDAVCLTVRALRSAGPNRARLRDKLAHVENFSGMSGTITFDRQGNNTTTVHVVDAGKKQPSIEAGK